MELSNDEVSFLNEEDRWAYLL